MAQALWGDTENVTKFVGGNIDVPKRLAVEMANEKEGGIQYWPMFERAFTDPTTLDESKRTLATFAGCCGLKPRPTSSGPNEKVFEFGFYLRPTCWGRGLAVEGGLGVMNHAFYRLNVTSLMAGHHPQNIASKRTLEKLGFRFTHSEFYEPTGLIHPCYTITKDEFLHRFSGLGRPGEMEVWGLGLFPEVWGRRIGAVLLHAAVQHMVELGGRTAMLWCLRTNKQARHFYEREGWTHDGVEDVTYRGETPLWSVRYVRDLPQKPVASTSTATTSSASPSTTSTVLPPSVLLRLVQPQDAVEIGRVQEAAWRSSYTDLLPPSALDSVFAEPGFLEKWRQRIVAPDTNQINLKTFVAVEQPQQQVVGFITIKQAEEKDWVPSNHAIVATPDGEDLVPYLNATGLGDTVSVISDPSLLETTTAATTSTTTTDGIDPNVSNWTDLDEFDREIEESIKLTDDEIKAKTEQWEKENQAFLNAVEAKKSIPVGEISSLNLTPSAFGRGISSALMRQACTQLESYRYQEAILWVVAANGRARRFYEKCGFRLDGGRQVDQTRQYPLEEVRYRKRLTADKPLSIYADFKAI